MAVYYALYCLETLPFNSVTDKYLMYAPDPQYLLQAC